MIITTLLWIFFLIFLKSNSLLQEPMRKVITGPISHIGLSISSYSWPDNSLSDWEAIFLGVIDCIWLRRCPTFLRTGSKLSVASISLKLLHLSGSRKIRGKVSYSADVHLWCTIYRCHSLNYSFLETISMILSAEFRYCKTEEWGEGEDLLQMYNEPRLNHFYLFLSYLY